jgi:hypothetical protein
MEAFTPSSPTSQPPSLWWKHLLLVGGLIAAVWWGRSWWLPPAKAKVQLNHAIRPRGAGERQVVQAIDAQIDQAIVSMKLEPAGMADWATVCRRLSLGLVGSTLSLEEWRAIESLEPSARVEWWTDHLLSDRRWADYFAQRLARAFVGTQQGPFLVFRRRRFETWLADELAQGTAYDVLVRKLVTAEGLWTNQPEVNFLTATISKEGGRKVDEVALAGRTARAFLGLRIDCLQCHDDFLGNVALGDAEASRGGKQRDFHQLAAFYAGAGISRNPLAGLRDSRRPYLATLLGDSEPTKLEPQVPFGEGFDPVSGSARERLAAWLTDPSNLPFARATVNRVWAWMFGKPMVEPVDSLPLHGPFPPGLETLAQSFIEDHFDLRQLIRTITATEAFRRESRLMGQPVLAAHEAAWAVFPLTALRPEQVAASLHQACRLQLVDDDSPIFLQLERFGTLRDFTRAFGDRGEDEFVGEGVTIPQRLLVMNGKFIRQRIENNPWLNAATQVSLLAGSDQAALEAAFLATLNRKPTAEELAYFLPRLPTGGWGERGRAFADLYWRGTA